MKDWGDFGATQWVWHTWESSALTISPLLHDYKESENFRLKIHFFKIVNKINSFIIHLKRCKYKYKSLEYNLLYAQ